MFDHCTSQDKSNWISKKQRGQLRREHAVVRWEMSDEPAEHLTPLRRRREGLSANLLTRESDQWGVITSSDLGHRLLPSFSVCLADAGFVQVRVLCGTRLQILGATNAVRFAERVRVSTSVPHTTTIHRCSPFNPFVRELFYVPTCRPKSPTASREIYDHLLSHAHTGIKSLRYFMCPPWANFVPIADATDQAFKQPFLDAPLHLKMQSRQGVGARRRIHFSFKVIAEKKRLFASSMQPLCLYRYPIS